MKKLDHHMAADVVIYLNVEGDDRLLSELDFDLKPSMDSSGKVTMLYGPRGSRSSVLVGLGAQDRLDAEQIRRAAGNAARTIGREDFRFVAVNLDLNTERLSLEEIVKAWVEGWLLGDYAFDKYKQHPQIKTVEQLFLIIGDKSSISSVSKLTNVIANTRLRAESTILARDWCNEPANVMTPEYVVEQSRHLFLDRNVDLRIYQGDELVQYGMNGLLAVSQGSRQKPALIEIKYVSDPTQPLLSLVGKGMTFDMGGMNVKTGRDLSEARFDMGGACAIIGAMDFLIRIEAPANVVALIAVADNVPGSGALLPSSIIRYPNGMTVQVGNTDAEGRLILADALLHAERLGATEIIDIATLTGSVGHALGLRVAGVWGDRSNSEKLSDLGE